MAQELMGSVLIATQYIGEPEFKKSVVLICDSSKFGVFGLLLNGEKIDDDSEDLKRPEFMQNRPDLTILNGGVNNHESVFIIHDPVPDNSANLLISYDFFSVSLLTSETMHELNRYKNKIIVSGYMQWTASQLSNELKNMYWLVGDADQELLFDTPADSVWFKALKRTNIRLSLLSPQTYVL